MMESFSYFDKEQIDRLRNYWAHTHQIKNPESLADHTVLVMEYAKKLVDVHHILPVLKRLISPLTSSSIVTSPDSFGGEVEKLFWDTIVFHDFGKINENFQVEKMKNPQFEKNRANHLGTHHSLLSSHLYILQHLQKIYGSKQLKEEEAVLLYVLVFLFSIPILKHHSSHLAKDFPYIKDNFDPLKPYLEKMDIPVVKKIFDAFWEPNKLETITKQVIEEYFPQQFYFPLFLLLKLSYSLLTASDYYATSHYRMDFEIDDFGILSENDKETLFKNFRTIKSYNKEFFEKRESIQNLSLAEISERTPDNLDRLRLKLFDEVLAKLRESPNEHIYYLEAPTGSGKTNLSMAVALEILKRNSELNKIFYVFPFTTLVTQTSNSLRETLGLTSDQLIELHSRSGFPIKHEEEKYGADALNYIDYLFVNYPITLLTHVKFFDILKSNFKEPNYILHRLVNSVIIIDELQSYPPKEWDKIAYFIEQFSHYFNARFILMSATLPKLSDLQVNPVKGRFYPLVKNKQNFFQNSNFRDRVQFDFSMFEKEVDIEKLADIVLSESEKYANRNNGHVKTIVEFIYKKTAGAFYRQLLKSAKEMEYKLLLLSGTILEPRRKEVIEILKSSKDDIDEKVILVTTQVVEAGVDIDMDIGFKDRSLIDSDEQLAGRVNRNASKNQAKVFLFRLDSAFRIYGNDLRYKITRDEIKRYDYEKILQSKDFDYLYRKVCYKINEQNKDEFVRNFDDYKSKIKQLDFFRINNGFKIIDQENITIFVPLQICIKHFTKKEINFLRHVKAYENGKWIDGRSVWDSYIHLVKTPSQDFIEKQISVKRMYSIMSKFMFSVFAHSSLLAELKRFCDPTYYEDFKMLYLAEWQEVYDYKMGIDESKFNQAAFI